MASNATKSSPPVFDEKIHTWKEYMKELYMWKSLTSLEKYKQGPALYLSLKGRAKEVVKDLNNEEIVGDDGIDKISDALDAIFRKEENQEAFITYK